MSRSLFPPTGPHHGVLRKSDRVDCPMLGTKLDSPTYRLSIFRPHTVHAGVRASAAWANAGSPAPGSRLSARRRRCRTLVESLTSMSAGRQEGHIEHAVG